MKKILPLIALFGALACPAFGQYSLGKIGPGDVPCAYVSCTVSTLTALGLSTTVATSQSQASGGSTLLAFATTAGLSTGRVVSGTSIPLGDTIASIVSTAEVTRATTSGSSSGQKLVNFTSTTGFGVGQQCTDTTAPSAIGAGNVIASIQANVSITMTTNLTGNAGSGDTIVCDPVVTLTTTSSGTIAAAANILFIPNATSLSVSSAIYDAGDLSVAGNMLGGRLSIGGAALGTDALAVTGTATFNGNVTIAGTAAIGQTSTTANNFGGSITVGGASNGSAYLNRAGGFGTMEVRSVDGYSWSSSSSNQTATPDLNFCRSDSTTVEIGSGACGANGSMLLTNITGTGAAIKFTGITTGTNADTVCYKSDGTLLIQAAACTISSMRFKTDIHPFAAPVSPAIFRLPVVTFKLKDGAKNIDPNAKTVELGLLAEDVAKIVPICAIYENDMKTPKSYRQECLIAALVKTVQEQHAANDNLEHRVRALETTAARKRGMAP